MLRRYVLRRSDEDELNLCALLHGHSHARRFPGGSTVSKQNGSKLFGIVDDIGINKKRLTQDRTKCSYLKSSRKVRPCSRSCGRHCLTGRDKQFFRSAPPHEHTPTSRAASVRQARVSGVQVGQDSTGDAKFCRFASEIFGTSSIPKK